MKKTLAVIVLAMVAALALCLVGCGGGGTTETGDGYKIENQKLVNKDGNAYISGKLTNTSGEQHNILVSWYAYDSGKNGIGIAEFNANMIQPNEKYDFEVPFLDSKNENVRYDSVKQYLFAEAHFTDVETQIYLDSLGQTDKGDGFTIKNEELFAMSNGDAGVKGKFVNESGSDRDHIYLSWKLFDKNGKQIGETSVLIEKKVKAGDTIDVKSETTLPTNSRGDISGSNSVKATSVESFELDTLMSTAL